MIYLVSKIVISLLAALGIGFGMAWMLQMHLAARLREQLNSVIFETKSRIPQLESEITNRDQTIDGLREELAQKPKVAEPSKAQQGNKEQEKQIDELRQQVIDLENELRMARGVSGEEETVFEIDEADRVQVDDTELMSDDEFLADIQDIFEDADDSVEAFGRTPEEAATETQKEPNKPTAEDTQKSIEEDLQNELEGWDDKPSDLTPESNDADQVGTDSSLETNEILDSPRPLEEHQARAAKPPLRSGPIDLKAELLELEDEIRAGSDHASQLAQKHDAGETEKLKEEIEELTEARKSLNEIVDTQAKEMAGLQQQRDLQEKSLTVLNQQLELARMANERILRELREVKDGKSATGDKPRSATGS